MSSGWTKYCRKCGAGTVCAIPEGDDRERDVCSQCGDVHYMNPKVIVGSVCTIGEKLLLCKRAIEPRRGFWTIPAGFMELGETAAEGAAREAFEEANARIHIDDLIAVYSIPHIGQVQILFRASLIDKTVSPGVESLETELLPWSKIPWEDLAFPSVHWVLKWAETIRNQKGPIVPSTINGTASR